MLLVSLASLVLTACSAPKQESVITKQGLYGDWICRMDYEDIDIVSHDAITLKPNGEFIDNNDMLYPIDKPFFSYQIFSYGKWDLKGDQLTYTIENQKVSREKNAEFLKRLKAKSKTKQDKDLFAKASKVENNLFELLNKQDNKPDVIELDIIGAANGTFAVHQKIGDTVYKGVCVTPERLDDIRRAKK